MSLPHSFFPIREVGGAVIILDQTELPHRRVELELNSLEAAAHAIRAMQVRGAPLIGATAAWGLALAMAEDPSDAGLASALALLGATRPTAVNLRWALERLGAVLAPLPASARLEAARREARAVCAEDEAANRAIGLHGLSFISEIAGRKPGPVHIMTHCNAGALATVAWGTALAPVYAAKLAGVPVHVWVSETRPRNQGLLTAWEMREAGIPHTYVADNASAYLMANGKVDLVIVGADRIAANGDVANKVGTALKALACREWSVPFYVAAPSSTLDWQCAEGAAIPIEERGGEEVRRVQGAEGSVTLIPEASPVANPAFDVTPARLVTAIITERGAVAPDRLHELFPENSTH
jgi:methylthioribose-1-phosphate isomerase